jgi:hypothetical protein
MKIEVRKSFEIDDAGVNNKQLALAISTLISELENCHSLAEIHHVKKLVGSGI